MDIKRLNEIGRRLNEELRLKTTPLGIKFFEKPGDNKGLPVFQITSIVFITIIVKSYSFHYVI